MIPVIALTGALAARHLLRGTGRGRRMMMTFLMGSNGGTSLDQTNQGKKFGTRAMWMRKRPLVVMIWKAIESLLACQPWVPWSLIISSPRKYSSIYIAFARILIIRLLIGFSYSVLRFCSFRASALKWHPDKHQGSSQVSIGCFCNNLWHTGCECWARTCVEVLILNRSVYCRLKQRRSSGVVSKRTTPCLVPSNRVALSSHRSGSWQACRNKGSFLGARQRRRN